MLPLSWIFVHQVTDLVDHSFNLIKRMVFKEWPTLKQYLLKRSAIASYMHMCIFFWLQFYITVDMYDAIPENGNLLQ